MEGEQTPIDPIGHNQHQQEQRSTRSQSITSDQPKEHNSKEKMEVDAPHSRPGSGSSTATGHYSFFLFFSLSIILGEGIDKHETSVAPHSTEGSNSPSTVSNNPPPSKENEEITLLPTEETKIPPPPPAKKGPEWFDVQFHSGSSVIKPKELVEQIPLPPASTEEELLGRIKGSMLGMAIGDALGAHVEFRPREYLVKNPVEDLGSGGTWGLQRGQVSRHCSLQLKKDISLVHR